MKKRMAWTATATAPIDRIQRSVVSPRCDGCQRSELHMIGMIAMIPR